jgi:copper oxidase (laccase) domain-containing protein
LAKQFAEKFGSDVVETGAAGTPHLNLQAVALLQLQQSNVAEIDMAHLCTHCHPELFFSFRRDGSSGRQMSFISLAF